MQTLRELAKLYNTDKDPDYKGPRTGHRYSLFYETMFAPIREQVLNVLEIGIESGASLRMWRDYFPNAQITGIDIDPATLITEDRIQSVQADANKLEGMVSCVPFDIIIDDGYHSAESQIAALNVLFPQLTPYGIYIIEDVKEQSIESVRDAAMRFGWTYVDEFDPEHPTHDDRLIVVTRRCES